MGVVVVVLAGWKRSKIVPNVMAESRVHVYCTPTKRMGGKEAKVS